MMSRSIRRIRNLTGRLMICLMLMVPGVSSVQAQWVSSEGEASSDVPPFEDNVADVPVDGGLSLLLAAGALYGGRRLRRMRSARPK